MPRDVLDVRLALLVVPDLGPQCTWLLKIKLGDLAQVSVGSSRECFMPRDMFQISRTAVQCAFATGICQGLDATLVVRPVALGNESCRAVALEVGDGYDRSVDRELLIVDS